MKSVRGSDWRVRQIAPPENLRVHPMLAHTSVRQSVRQFVCLSPFAQTATCFTARNACWWEPSRRWRQVCGLRTCRLWTLIRRHATVC